MSHTCAACRRELADQAALCHLCTGRLRRNLLDVPDLMAELETTALRQVNTADGRGGDAIPYDQRARDAQHAIRNAVNGWCRVVLGEIGCDDPEDLYRRGAALWLADQTGRIRLKGWADDCAADIATVTRAGWRAVDRPEQRWYAGPCGADIADRETGDPTECGRVLWVRIEDISVRCPACETLWPVVARREWLMTAAWDIHETAQVIASAITLMTRSRITASNIRNWASEGMLRPAGERGLAKLYRVGDVIELTQRRDQRRETDARHATVSA